MANVSKPNPTLRGEIVSLFADMYDVLDEDGGYHYDYESFRDRHLAVAFDNLHWVLSDKLHAYNVDYFYYVEELFDVGISYEVCIEYAQELFAGDTTTFETIHGLQRVKQLSSKLMRTKPFSREYRDYYWQMHHAWEYICNAIDRRYHHLASDILASLEGYSLSDVCNEIIARVLRKGVD
jgi:hypothetical protein